MLCIFCHSVYVLHVEGRGCPKGNGFTSVPSKLPLKLSQHGEVRKYIACAQCSYIISHSYYIILEVTSSMRAITYSIRLLWALFASFRLAGPGLLWALCTCLTSSRIFFKFSFGDFFVKLFCSSSSL